MSVINKVLRDLDSRQTAEQPVRHADAARLYPKGLVNGVVVVGGESGPGRARPLIDWRVALVMLLVLLAGAAGLMWWLRPPTVIKPAWLVPSTPAVPTVTPTAVPTSNPRLPMPVPASVEAPAPRQTASALAAPKPRTDAVASPASVAVPATAAVMARGAAVAGPAASMPVPGALASDPSPDLVRAPPATSATNVSEARSERAGTAELAAQAQLLWNNGDRRAALALLHSALLRLEQAAANPSALAQLAREHARMSLAMGQPADALAMLERLEPQLAGVADIWAMRGNAAQRLGQHAQAVAAYQRGLALRPDESRWLLGAAVSLAAMGQTSAAAELAEKARSVKALPPDVANYLRQLGVAVRSD